MSTAATSPRSRAPLPALTRLETLRLVRNPVFVALVILTVYLLKDLSRVIVEADEIPSYPAGFFGGLGMIVTCWLTQSLNRSADMLDVTPTSLRTRTTALCLTALVPFAGAVFFFVFFLMWRAPQGFWTYGAFGSIDRAAVQVSQLLVPALGGPLLGIALGRWFRQVWVGPAALLVIVGWIELPEGLATTHQHSQVVTAMRLFAPYALFTVSDNGGQSVETWRGSPVAFLGWQLCLCALAAVVALLYRADPALRRRLINALLVIALLAACYYLAVTGGFHHAVVVYPGSPPQPL